MATTPDDAAVVDFAGRHLGIEDPDRLREYAELAPIVRWIASGIRRLQEERPEEPPPATIFSPEVMARDFWAGPHG